MVIETSMGTQQTCQYDLPPVQNEAALIWTRPIEIHTKLITQQGFPINRSSIDIEEMLCILGDETQPVLDVVK